MIDIKLIRDNPNLLKEQYKKLFDDENIFGLIDEIIDLDNQIKILKNEEEKINHILNSLNKQFGLLISDKKLSVKDINNILSQVVIELNNKNYDAAIEIMSKKETKLEIQEIENALGEYKKSVSII